MLSVITAALLLAGRPDQDIDRHQLTGGVTSLVAPGALPVS
jgi:hypothetical protein